MKIYKYLKKIFSSKSEKWIMLGTLVGLFVVFIIQIVLSFQEENLDLYFPESALVGVPLAEEQYLYEQGIVSIEVKDMVKGESISLYVNGIQKGFTNGARVNLTVKVGDVLEIMGNTVNEPRKVEITSVAGQISQDYVGKSMMCDNKVRILIRIT